MNLTKFSLKRPVTTLLVVLALAVFGIALTSLVLSSLCSLL